MPSLRREKLFVLTLSTLMRKGYQAYGLGARRELPPAVPVATVTSATTLGSYANDLYYAYRYGALSGDPYLPSVRREEVPSGSYSVGGTFPGATAHLRRIETDQGADRLYSSLHICCRCPTAL
nr:hypothetical protein CFP56_78709 [Quercus suber]